MVDIRYKPAIMLPLLAIAMLMFIGGAYFSNDLGFEHLAVFLFAAFIPLSAGLWILLTWDEY